MSRRRRRKRRPVWLAVFPLLAAAGSGPVLRWVLLPVAGTACLVLPVLAWSAGGLRPLLTPRRVRMAQRKPYTDPRTSQLVRHPRPALPKRLRDIIMAADRSRCVACKRSPRRHGVKLQFDHYIPWSFGGLSSLFNVMLLCAECNRVKSNYWRSDSGKVYYRGWAGMTSATRAGGITRRELIARHSPLRWARVGLAWWMTR